MQYANVSFYTNVASGPTKEIEIIGTEPDAIFDAKERIEAARWLNQCEEDLAAHMERERLMRKHLDAIADIVDELDYSDKFLGLRQNAKQFTTDKPWREGPPGEPWIQNSH